METIIIVTSVMGGGLIVGFMGLVGYAKYITKKLCIENEEKMNNACNKLADKIEEDLKKLGKTSLDEIELK